MLAKKNLPPISAFDLPETTLDSRSEGWLQKLESSEIMRQVRQMNADARFAYVRVKDLVTPLVLVDHEYVEMLRPELISLDAADVVKFALPEGTPLAVKAMMDPTRRSITLVSNQKTLSVSPLQVTQTEEGVEVRFTVGANVSQITVSLFQDRLILRNGIHRAYLLAKLGLETIPCLLVHELALPNMLSVAYPAFVPESLIQRRPPLLADFLDPVLSIDVPLQRTHKVARISAEELLLPVD